MAQKERLKEVLTLLALGLILTMMPACQKKPAPIDFDRSYSISAAFDKAVSSVKITVNLEKSVHAYAAKEPYGKPVRVEIKEANGWAATAPAIIPEGQKKTLPGQKDSYILDQSFTIVQPVQAGSGEGSALLHMQLCTDTQCDRPRQHELFFK